MIELNVEKIRDPFMLVDNGIYYLYGTKVTNDWDRTYWCCFKNDSGSLDGEWTEVENAVNFPKYALKQKWAPEVHRYNGAYYMFATYYSLRTEHRGCSVFKSLSPEGPFNEISSGHITPPGYDAIDGTLYVDEDGQPWVVFVREWTGTKDNIGRMAAAKMSDDLTQIVSEPIELFRADAPSWAGDKVTDGCFLYKTKTNKLLMIWSNFCKDGYCVGVAHSDTGKLDGNWIQEDNLLFSKQQSGKYDGGHGMIFTDVDCKKYLCIHSPNLPEGTRYEQPLLVEVKEIGDTIVCDFT